MHLINRRRSWSGRVVLLFTLLVPSAGVSQAPSALVASGVTDFAFAAPKVYWHTAAGCPSTPPRIVAAALVARDASDPEVISRIASYGSGMRQLFVSNEARPAGVCNPYHFYSNIVADDNALYWIDDTGLVSLPTTANPGDAPTLLSGAINGKGKYAAELAQEGNLLYVLTYDAAGASTLTLADKTLTIVFPGSPVSDSRTTLTDDGQYRYWIQGPNLDLKRSATAGVTTIASGVTGYHAEGTRRNCTGRLCFDTQLVYIGEGPQLSYHSNLDGTSQRLYTSTESQAQIYAITSDANNIYFFEDRPVPCTQPPCLFGDHQDVLVRTSRSGAAPAVLYVHQVHLTTDTASTHLVNEGTFLFWQENGAILRLPKDANALSMTNMHLTGMEVTQSVQDLNNSVRLIQNKRTFVRVYVHSDGASVAGVTAWLFGSWDDTGGGPLEPVNPVGKTITVSTSPSRTNIDDGFLFELPWDWTTHGDLTLRAELNPYRVPLQASYADNSFSDGPFHFDPSPRLDIQFVAFGYTLNGTTYYPRVVQDVLGNYSWIRRVYPIAGIPGFFTDPGPGLRTNLWIVGDADLGARVAQTAPECTDNLCASAFANKKLDALRKENGIPDSVFMYGMISDGGGFPRGQACCGKNVSTGPSGDSWLGYYAGHEIGHTLGRGHPQSGNGECGLVGSDPDPVYPNAFIGPFDGSISGFDAGDPGLGQPMAVLHGVIPLGGFSYDFMAYCQPNWISDTNYENIYNYMMQHPPPEGSGAALHAVPRAVAGDFLHVIGEISADGTSASISHLQRLSTVASPPASVPGNYSIELFDTQGTLATTSFTPRVSEDAGGALSFSEVVDFMPGTQGVRIRNVTTGAELASQSVSANPPTVTDVALQGATEPVTGTVTLNWDASDPDGDTLRFDVLYSRDGGATLQPLLMALRDINADIDTTRLGGGTAILRVVASDGVNTASADSAPFTVANKPPQPHILLPADGLHVHYGQLINFSGEAEDFQDGGVADAGLQWSTQRGPLGTGAMLSIANLPVGTNQVTLTATNSVGLAAADNVTVIVDDDLTLPGPTLSVAPTQIVLNTEAGDTQIQTAALAIGNSGDGDLTWQAQSDAAWVTLDAVSGGTPGSVTVNADPSGFAAGTDNHAHVVLTVGDDPNQSVSVPVDLVIGNLFAGPPAPPRPCVGDCDASHTVSIDELVTGVRIALGHGTVNECPSFDCSETGQVTIDCLVRAVDNALRDECL